MKVSITGSGGFIGSEITRNFKEHSIEIIRLSRDLLQNDCTEIAEAIKSSDVVINLAGAPIFSGRWNQKKKDLIYNSRINTTRKLVQSISLLEESIRPTLLLNASAIGVYSPHKIHDEYSADLRNDFLGKVIKDWEKEANRVTEYKVRVAILRFGLVIGKNGGVLNRLLPLYRIGLGGKLGNGKQPFPYVCIEDIINAINFLITHPECNAVYNLTAPVNCTQKEFSSILAHTLHRPAIFTVPAFVLKILLGKSSHELLHTPHVISRRLTEAGFKFEYPDLQSTLNYLQLRY
ncbi:MAG: TIGR01777 family oxidoreductase [Bacteroidota bacterium]|nr:TIGR01777 family oxidoreductase [Bacteroidota bacterium]